MKLLFDSWCSQVLFQRAAPSYPAGVSPGNGAPNPTGMRLKTLLGAIHSIGLSSNNPWHVTFTTPPITAAQLQGVDVYISLTRYQGTGFAYTSPELHALETFIAGGGDVLLLSNHGGFPSKPNDDWTHNDAPLAALFGVTLQNYSVQSYNNPPNPTDVMSVLGNVAYIRNQAPTITAHNSCIIVPPASFTEIARFPSSWTAYKPTTSTYSAPPTPYFCLLVPGPGAGAGSLIVGGNSGWTGDYGSPNPACGLIPYESNLMFVLNAIGYLGGLTTIPPAGHCP